MNPTKHTPGPWRLVEDAQGPCMVMHPSNLTAIASLTDAHKPVHGFHEVENWPHERNANARLIAAAPELLAALVVMADRAARQNWKDLYTDELAQVLAAIAKATKEQQ